MTKLIKLNINLMIEKYKDGSTTRELASEFKVNPSTIQDRLRKCGEIRKIGRLRIYSDEERKQRRRDNDKIYNASEAARESHRRRCKKDRQKVRARWTVATAVKAGKIPKVSTQKCFDCRETANEYDHYLGYENNHMLDIQAVCYVCHRNREKNRIKNEI